MAFVTNRITVPTTGWTPLDSATDTDRNAGGSIMGGQGLAIKNTGTTQILIVGAAQDASKAWLLDAGEVFPADLDLGDHVYGRSLVSSGEVATAQVGVTGP